MFYSYSILAKKGPLANVWLAAHWKKKLTKSAVFQTNVSDTCQDIQAPVVPLALRVSGHLLLGVVTVYSKQVGYLFADCSEAMHKIRMAFKTGDVNLPEDDHKDTTIVQGFGDFGFLPEHDDLSDVEDGTVLDGDDWMLVDDRDSQYEEAPDSTMDDDEEMLPPADDDDDDDLDIEISRHASKAAGAGSVHGSVPESVPGSVPGSDGSMPVFRKDLETPQARRETVGLAGGPEFDDEDDLGFGEDQYDDDLPPPPLEEPSSTDSRRKSKLTTPLADMDIDATPVSVRVKAPEVELLTADDLEEPDVATRRVKAAKRKKRALPVQDEETQLDKSTFKEWRKNTHELYLPRQTTAKRLRRQREVAEVKYRRALGFKEPEKMLYVPPCMRACCPELLEVYDDIEKGGFPAERDSDFSDDDEDDVGATEKVEAGSEGSRLEPFDDDDLGFGEDQYSDDMDGALEGKGSDGEGSDMEGVAPMATAEFESDGEDMMGAMEEVDSAGEEEDPDKLKDMMQVLDAAMERDGSDEVVYQTLSKGVSRHLVADCFWKILKLKSLNLIELEQAEPYADIRITKMDAFDSAMKSGSFSPEEAPTDGMEVDA